MDDFCNANYFRHSYIIIVKQMLSSISRCALNDYNFFFNGKTKTNKNESSSHRQFFKEVDRLLTPD